MCRGVSGLALRIDLLDRDGDAAGDAQTLAADIEWDGVREGLKEDIADGITGQPGSSTAVASDALPAFGSGFVRSMAGNMVDETVTPEHLATSFSALQAAGANHTQPGDPAKLASALLQLADSATPPVRLQLGSDTVQRVRAKNQFVEQEMTQWLDVALSTDRDDVVKQAA